MEEKIKQLKLKRDSIRTQIFYKDKYNEDYNKFFINFSVKSWKIELNN